MFRPLVAGKWMNQLSGLFNVILSLLSQWNSLCKRSWIWLMYYPVTVNFITSFWKWCTLSSYNPYYHIQAKQTPWAASLLGQYMYFNQRNRRQDKVINSWHCYPTEVASKSGLLDNGLLARPSETGCSCKKIQLLKLRPIGRCCLQHNCSVLLHIGWQRWGTAALGNWAGLQQYRKAVV